VCSGTRGGLASWKDGRLTHYPELAEPDSEPSPDAQDHGGYPRREYCGFGKRVVTKMRLTLKAINEELAKRGYLARLAKGNGYFYFHFGEVADWLDRTVRVPTVSSLTLAEWISEFQRLKKLNAEIMRPAKKPGLNRKSTKRGG